MDAQWGAARRRPAPLHPPKQQRLPAGCQLSSLLSRPSGRLSSGRSKGAGGTCGRARARQPASPRAGGPTASDNRTIEGGRSWSFLWRLQTFQLGHEPWLQQTSSRHASHIQGYSRVHYVSCCSHGQHGAGCPVSGAEAAPRLCCSSVRARHRGVVVSGGCSAAAGGLHAAAADSRRQAPLRRCQRLLPALWVQRLENWLAPAMPFVAVVQQHLASLQSNGGGGGSGSGGTSVGGGSTHEQTMQAVCAAAGRAVCALRAVRPERDLKCSGCGKPAVGLRRCSRCKMAQYCR